jgi:hypothetical protein
MKNDTSSNQARSSRLAKRNEGAGEQWQNTALSSVRPSMEQTVPLMLRPKLSQKMCAETMADQLGIKRSQLDPLFYITGALLYGVEQLGRREMIGTWTRKEVAVFLKGAFNPLFELLYEQDELPLVFSLLIGRETVPTRSQHVPDAVGIGSMNGQAPWREASSSAGEYLPELSEDAEVGLDGFPEGI